MNKIVAQLWDNDKNEGATYEEYNDTSTQEGIEFMWTEGNFACDCNRALMFARALGQTEPDDPPCGGKRYALKSLTFNNIELLERS